MKKQERSVKQQVASVWSTVYAILGIVKIAFVDTHWVFGLLAVFCFIIAFQYNKLSNN